MKEGFLQESRTATFSFPGVRMARRISAFGLACLVAAAAQAAAQEIGVVVVDARSGTPLAGAQVVLRTTEEAPPRILMSNREGAFTIPEAVLPVRITVRRIGYQLRSTVVAEAEPARDLPLVFELEPVPIELPGMVVRVEPQLQRSPVLENYRWRQHRGLGRYITREEIKRSSAFYPSDLVRRIPGVRVSSGNHRGGRIIYFGRGAGCPAEIYIDGVLANRPIRRESARVGSQVITRTIASDLDFTLDELVRVFDIEGIEVYSGLASVPAELMGPNAHCGVVAVWTRRYEP
jgi:hypothetical protein